MLLQDHQMFTIVDLSEVIPTFCYRIRNVFTSTISFENTAVQIHTHSINAFTP